MAALAEAELAQREALRRGLRALLWEATARAL